MGEVKRSDITFYEANARLDEYKRSLKNNFVGIGYTLKRVREDKLFLEAGYKNFDEFMNAKYGKDKSWASKCINIAVQFGKGEDTPVIQDKYADYEFNKLVELIYLPEDKRQEVTSKTSVRAIRELKPKKEKKVSTVETPEPPKWNTDPTPCIRREEYSCTVPDDKKSIPGDGSNCGQSCCWECTKRGDCKWECNSSQSRPEEPILAPTEPETPKPIKPEILHVYEDQQPDESWKFGSLPQAKEKYVRSLAQVLVEKKGKRLRYSTFSGGIDDDTIRWRLRELADETDQEIEIGDGVIAYPCAEIIEFTHGNEDLGICSYIRFGTQARKVLDEWKASQDSASKSAENDPQPDTVIDAEFKEVQEPEPANESLSDLQIAREELDRADRLLQTCLLSLPDQNDIHIRRMKVKVDALASYVCDMDAAENPAPSPEQPSLPLLKNNDQRAAFVDAYETWPLWIETVETGERYYRYDLSEGTSMVVKVYHARLFDYEAAWNCENRFHEGWGEEEYYLLQPEKFFKNCRVNRSALIEKLKDIQKEGGR